MMKASGSNRGQNPDRAFSVLVADDEAFTRRFFDTILREENHRCITAASAKECLTYLKNNAFPDLIILDVRLPDGNGLEILSWIRDHDKTVPVIVVTAYGSITEAVHAMKLGAFDFFTKPFEDTNKIKISIHNAFERVRLARENRTLRTRLQSQVFQNIIGKSKPMLDLFDMIKRAARVSSNVLIEGESGTGKELAARAIHNLSEQAENAFIPVNCAALPETLLESALFGYEKGAFTGAVKTTRGFFEEADGGTLFLDEIGEATPSVQAKLLRTVEEGTISRVGRAKPLPVNVRLIFATNKELGKEVAEGRFRKDLYYRINTIKMRIPPLRERKEDISLLANSFLEKYCMDAGVAKKVLDEGAISMLMERDWPGNVRELKNFVERTVALHSEEMIQASDLERFLEENLPGEEDLFALEYEKAKRNFEKRYFQKAIAKAAGDLNLASSLSGIHLATMYRKIKELGIGNK